MRLKVVNLSFYEGTIARQYPHPRTLSSARRPRAENQLHRDFQL